MCRNNEYSERESHACLPEPACLSRGLCEWLIQCFTLTSVTLHIEKHTQNSICKYAHWEYKQSVKLFKHHKDKIDRLTDTRHNTVFFYTNKHETAALASLKTRMKSSEKNGTNSSTHKGTQSISLAQFLLMYLHFSSYSLLTCRGHRTFPSPVFSIVFSNHSA